MPRWEPNAEQRLVDAAVDLYARQGYDHTTIGAIAAHAGVTSRTYFRYFPDKREVLFGNAEAFRARIVGSLRDAPPGLPAWPAVLVALSACADLFDRRDHARLRLRADVVEGSGELQEREARKRATIAADVAEVLRERGSDPDEARLVADLAMVVATHTARLWMADPATPYAVLVERAAAAVGAVSASVP